MKVLLDTSTIIAAMLARHSSHEGAARWLDAVHQQRVEGVVSAHSLAEVYATLSRVPTRPRLSPAMVGRLIRSNLIGLVTIAELSAQGYTKVIDDLAATGLAGGVVYDALHAKVAAETGVDTIVTLNVKDFIRVVDVSAIAVLSPEQQMPPN